LCLPISIFPTSFPIKTLYTPLLSLIRATCLAHLILLYCIARIIFREQYSYKSLSSSICSFLYPTCNLSFLGANILLNTLFSNTHYLRSSLTVSACISNYRLWNCVI
jgi:hypothetical protein